MGLICTHISIVFQRGACVSKPCIPALPASLSANPSPLKNVRCYCILAWMPRKSANTSIVFSIFRIHFYCVPAFSACISIAPGGFLDCSELQFLYLDCSELLGNFIWVVQKSCIPALLACISTCIFIMFQHFLRARSCCIPALPHAEKVPSGAHYACIFIAFLLFPSTSSIPVVL